jgi:hypothetical protein
MSQDIGMARTDDWSVRSSAFRGWAGWAAGGLVVPTWIEDQVAEELAGGGVDDADVQVLDEEQDVGSGVGSADADVVQAAGQAQGDAAGLVERVVAESVVGVTGAAGAGLGAGGRGGGPVRQRAVRSVVVVGGDEGVEEACSPVMVAGWTGWASSHFFIVCWNRSTVPQVVGWLGREFVCTTLRRRSSCSRWLRPPRPPAKRVV